VRVHPADHPSFGEELDIVLRGAGQVLAYIMVPKLRDVQQAREAIALIDDISRRHGVHREVPVHGLIETHGGLRDVMAIAALPRIESLSFGLMDFVSAHRGAVPASAMTSTGQFAHPLVLRAKLEIAAACHACGKTPSHGVVTEFSDQDALAAAARRAQQELGYTRMWSIHPDQVRVIVQAFAPATDEVDQASEILMAAHAVDWAPIRHRGAGGQDHLHDRASYRYYWYVLERAHHTGMTLSPDAKAAFFSEP